MLGFGIAVFCSGKNKPKIGPPYGYTHRVLAYVNLSFPNFCLPQAHALSTFSIGPPIGWTNGMRKQNKH